MHQIKGKGISVGYKKLLHLHSAEMAINHLYLSILKLLIICSPQS